MIINSPFFKHPVFKRNREKKNDNNTTSVVFILKSPDFKTSPVFNKFHSPLVVKFLKMIIFKIYCKSVTVVSLENSPLFRQAVFYLS